MSETTPEGRPAPLTPSDCDLRDFAFMPLDVERLRRSKAWLKAKRRKELAFYILNLWMSSWHEVPAASLENDDDVLADRAMCDPDVWEELKADILHGWQLCSDGRLYHPVVAEKALEAWKKKESYRERSKKGHASRYPKGSQPPDHPGDESAGGQGSPAERGSGDAPVPGEGASAVEGPGQQPLSTAADLHKQPFAAEKQASALPEPAKGQGQGQGQGQGEKQGQGKKRTSTAGSADGPTPGAVAFEAYREAYIARYKAEPLLNAKVRTQFKRFIELVGADDAPTLAAFFVGHPDAFYARRAHDPDLLVRDAGKLRTEWQTRTQLSGAQSEASGGRAARTEAWHAGMDDIPDEDFFATDGGMHAAGNHPHP